MNNPFSFRQDDLDHYALAFVQRQYEERGLEGTAFTIPSITPPAVTTVCGYRIEIPIPPPHPPPQQQERELQPQPQYYPCPYGCMKTYKGINSLQLHIYDTHGDDYGHEDNIYTMYGLPSFVCVCGRIFGTKWGLAGHKRNEHTNVRDFIEKVEIEYQCPSYKGDLFLRYRTEYKCKLCDYKPSTRRTDLCNHIRKYHREFIIKKD